MRTAYSHQVMAACADDAESTRVAAIPSNAVEPTVKTYRTVIVLPPSDSFIPRPANLRHRWRCVKANMWVTRLCRRSCPHNAGVRSPTRWPARILETQQQPAEPDAPPIAGPGVLHGCHCGSHVVCEGTWHSPAATSRPSRTVADTAGTDLQDSVKRTRSLTPCFGRAFAAHPRARP